MIFNAILAFHKGKVDNIFTCSGKNKNTLNLHCCA